MLRANLTVNINEQFLMKLFTRPQAYNLDRDVPFAGEVLFDCATR